MGSVGNGPERQRWSTAVPRCRGEAEKEALVRVLDEANGIGGEGKIASGFSLLHAGLLRAEAARDTGEPWADSMIDLYQAAMDRYAETHHLRPATHAVDPGRDGEQAVCP